MFAYPAVPVRVPVRLVVSFDVRILLQLARLNVINLDLMLFRPFRKFVTNKLRSIVTMDGHWFCSPFK